MVLRTIIVLLLFSNYLVNAESRNDRKTLYGHTDPLPGRPKTFIFDAEAKNDGAGHRQKRDASVPSTDTKSNVTIKILQQSGLIISRDFNDKWNFPNTIGALDGKHIVIKAPKAEGSSFYNYKGNHSIVLLGLVDANYKFLYVDVGTNGRVSDGGVFKRSKLADLLGKNQLNIPENAPLPGRTQPVPYVIVADAAFPLSEHILKPFPFRNMTLAQRIYNYRLSRARRVVENAFGILAHRFRVFLNVIHLSPEKAEIITLAGVTLHNFLRTELASDTIVDRRFRFKYGLSAQTHGNKSTQTALNTRLEFMEYVNGVGAVDWQNEYF